MTKSMTTGAALFLAGAFALTGCAAETGTPAPEEATTSASAPEEREATPDEPLPEIVAPTRPLSGVNPLHRGH